MNSIKAVIFDYGGVINVVPKSQGMGIHSFLCDGLQLNLEEFKTLYFANNYRNNLQNWTHKETLLYVVEALAPEKKEAAEKMIDSFLRDCTVNQELLASIKKIKELGYTIALLSNYNSELRHKIAENGVDQIFEDNIFISTEIGFQKPDPKAFEHTFEKLGLAPEEVIFIDDSPMSLSTAESVGYHPLRYTSNENLIADLKTFGILV